MVNSFMVDFTLGFYPVAVGIVLCTVGPRAVSGKRVCWPCGDLPGDAWCSNLPSSVCSVSSNI